jgi:hypothetical protein
MLYTVHTGRNRIYLLLKLFLILIDEQLNFNNHLDHALLLLLEMQILNLKRFIFQNSFLIKVCQRVELKSSRKKKSSR